MADTGAPELDMSTFKPLDNSTGNPSTQTQQPVNQTNEPELDMNTFKPLPGMENSVQPKVVDNNPEWRAGKLSEAYDLLKQGKIKEATHAALSIAPFVEKDSPERGIIDKIMDAAYSIPETVTKGLDAAATAVPSLDLNPAVGFIKGAEETAHSVGHVASKVAEAVSPQPIPESLKIGSEEPEYLKSTGAQQTVGKGTEAIAEFVLGDEALKGLSLAERLGIGQKIAKLAEEHPMIARMLHAGMNGIKGGVQTAAHGGDTTQSLESGGAVGGLDALLGAGGLAIKTMNEAAQPEALSIAGTKIPISKAQLAESPNATTSILKAGATPEAAQKFIENSTQPAAEAATRGNLGEVASNAIRETEMARGAKPKATVFSGNNPQDMIDTMGKNAQKTYKVLDDAAANAPEHFDKINDVNDAKAALEEAQQALKEHSQSIKGLEAGAQGPKQSSEALKIKSNNLKNAVSKAKEDYNDSRAALTEWENDNTFSKLQQQIRDAKMALSSNPGADKGKAAIMAIQNTQDKLQAFLDTYGGHVDRRELDAANSLWRKKEQFEYLQHTLNNVTTGTEGSPSALSKVKTNINYDTLKHLPGKFDNEFGTGAFDKLFGRQGRINFDNILNTLKNPKTGESFTNYAVKHGGLKSTVVGKVLGFFPDSILFNAEKGQQILNGFKQTQSQNSLRGVYNGLSSSLANTAQQQNREDNQ